MTSHRISTTETEMERKATETETERTPRKRRGVQKETETIITDAKRVEGVGDEGLVW